MARHPNLPRYALRGVLWTLLAFLAWLAAAQLFSIALSPSGYWQAPRLRRVKVMRLETDPLNSFTDRVLVTEGPDQKVLRMLKTERARLDVDRDVWIVDNIFASAVRPAQYRFTLGRCLLLFGPLLLPFVLLALWAEHRRPLLRPEALPLPEGRRRRVLTDDFHTRADQRRTD